MESKNLNCPRGHGEMALRHKQKHIVFRGVDVSYPVNYYACPTCSIEAGTLNQAAETQKAIADAYRKKVGLFTSSEIVKGRKKDGLSQEALANKMNVGIASIKRWEGAIIQSKSMDKMLRYALSGGFCGNPITGNRSFSIPRVKLVLKYLEKISKKEIIKDQDRMLYAAKYAWYIDMVSFRELGQSMTGASYAKLPMGPQLDNYKDLVSEIIKADESKADPLADDEKRIIKKVAMAFPRKQMVFQAAHRENIWKEKQTGAKIPYTDAPQLTEI